MSNRAERRRGPQIPPRPQFVNEQMREELGRQLGNVPRIFGRDQCMEIAVAGVVNLANILNSKKNLPWLQTTVERRADGISLHIQVLEPTSESDAQV